MYLLVLERRRIKHVYLTMCYFKGIRTAPIYFLMFSFSYISCPKDWSHWCSFKYGCTLLLRSCMVFNFTLHLSITFSQYFTCRVPMCFNSAPHWLYWSFTALTPLPLPHHHLCAQQFSSVHCSSAAHCACYCLYCFDLL